MAERITKARPYAKAVFAHAYSQGSLAFWSDCLHALALVLQEPKALRYINNPETSAEERESFLLSILCFASPEQKNLVINFLQVLERNKRITLLPDIFILYQALRAEAEKTLVVKVKSFSPLSVEQEHRLIASLSKRFACKVSLDIVIDKSLMGGAIISAGDWVRDGSVRGKINKLRTRLAA